MSFLFGHAPINQPPEAIGSCVRNIRIIVSASSVIIALLVSPPFTRQSVAWPSSIFERILPRIRKSVPKTINLEDAVPKPVDIKNISPMPHRFQLTRWGPFRFSRSFRKGLENPAAFLESLKITHPDVYKRWLSLPQHKRVYIIGHRGDEAKIRSYVNRNSSNGQQYFFYQDCQPLCMEEEIGAISAVAGAHVYLGREYGKSEYVILETAALKEEDVIAIPARDVVEASRKNVPIQASKFLVIHKGDCSDVGDSQICNY